MTTSSLRLCYDEINSNDMYSWRQATQKRNTDLLKFCQNNNFLFSKNLETDIQSQESGTYLVSTQDDLLMPLSYYEYINGLCKINNKVLGIVTENYVDWPTLSNVKFLFDKKLLGVFDIYSEDLLELQPPSKLYNCLMQRGDPLRQSFLYWLQHYQLLEQGYVSYLCVSGSKTKEGVVSPQKIYDAIQLNDNSEFEFRPPNITTLNLPPDSGSIYSYLRNKIPYQNFIEQHNLMPILKDSKYSLVIETFASDDDRNCWAFTEKAFRALQCPTIPLLFVQKHGCAKLVELGFAIPDFYQQFDALNMLERQSALLDIIASDSITLTSNILIKNAQHNRGLTKSWRIDLQKDQFWENLFVDFYATTS